ncbi:S9 family peptidase [Rubrivivax gelatinosus]|uniref:Acyl-peptide hydrolase n=1 Tax=Rubrivivax gelatinosus TaxID=28068 RepID=A0A4R2MGH0_RUBGE|nr:S9 family peptidase [Rubrivivax gelatinosus]TCP01846.1 dipeptidyl aminopeptidase/acylaminoacyl peptidase [Rubrivivax gelatinosus]
MKTKPITVDDLWKLERIGAPSLSPDGAQAVAAVTRYSMEDNKSASSLWLFSTLGGAARALTACGDKDGQPQWSPKGELVAFVAKREQQGEKDETAQLYVIAPDGGEARRAATVATGVEAFRWCPDGRRLLFVSWVWPDAKGTKEQAKRAKAFKERKETGYATREAQYRYWDHQLPQDREPHLHLLELGRDGAAAKVRDLFEGSPYALRRHDPDADCFDVSPDGKRVVFTFDPAPEKRIDNRLALAELELKTGRFSVLVQDADWDLSAPRYSPEGERIAFIASHQGRKHTMPGQVAVWYRDEARWELLSEAWDHDVQAPLAWEDDGQALLLRAEQRGRQHLWRFDLPDRRAEIVVEGGTVQAFDKAAGTLLTLADGATHPARLQACLPGEAPRRIETINDALLERLQSGRVEEVWIKGAASVEGGEPDDVQMWLVYPPGFDAKKKYPILHLIHGGPHTAFGDAWHYRWNTQVFAAQGYVVACVNYHGSSSFGTAFLDSITHRWGQLETIDVEAATDWLLKKPWADKRRVFASGGSYGGFMVAWMNGHVPAGRYAAYVCHAGCFDWTGMFADDAYTWHAKELGAWYWDDMARVHAQSPHAAAGAMATPTLVVHGALDYRVPDAQGLAYYNTLKARGVDARLLWYPDENHWVLKPRNSKQWYGEFFGWLERHDPGPAKTRKR